MSSVESLQSLANDIASGFDALIERLDDQRKVEDDLKQQLSRAFDRVRVIRFRFRLLLGCYNL